MKQGKKLMGMICVSTMLMFLLISGITIVFINFISNNHNQFYRLGFSNIYIIPITIFLLIGIIGISKRSYIVYNLLLAVFLFLAFSSIYKLIVALSYGYIFLNVINYVFLLILSVLIIWYLIRRKDYFKDTKKVIDIKNPLLKKEELFFTITFLMLWIIYFFIIPLVK